MNMPLTIRFKLCALVALLALGVAVTPARTRAQTHAQGAQASADENKTKPRPEFENDEDGSKLLKRLEWFYGPRKYPHDHLPPGARLSALKQKAAKDAAEAAGRRHPGRPPVTQPAWSSIGPMPINENASWGLATGRTTALAIDPTNTQIIYAGAAEGGVWKTTDGGANWTPMTDSQVSLASGSIAIDPENHLTIYVGTGEENFSIDSYYGAGVLKSTDGGITWTLNGQASFGFNGTCSNATIGAIAVQPTNSSVVLAGAGYCGIWRSTDGGVTWSQPAPVLNTTPVTSIIFDPSTPTTVYASAGDIFGTFDNAAPGVYKSTNSGATWTLMSAGLPAGGRETLALAASSSTTLYVGIQDPANLGNALGIWKSTDGANTWTQTNAPSGSTSYCTAQCWYDSPLAVSPVNSNVVYAGGQASSIYVSLDGGNTWTLQDDSSGLHVDEHAFAFTPDGSTLYCAGDGGVWVDTNPNVNPAIWSSVNTTFDTAEYYPGISIDPQDVNITFGGTQDNFMEEYTGSSEWTTVTCGDGGATAIDSVNPLNVYVNCIEQSLLKSTDGGMTFNTMQNGFNTSDPTAWAPPLAIDPEISTNLYFGTNHAYQTTNGAALWTEISGDLTSGNGNTLSALTVAPSDSNTVYSGSSDGTPSVTRNALSGVGATWTNIGSQTELPTRAITAIAVDPAHPTTAYYTYSGFTNPTFGDNFGHVFMTTDAGTSWTDISGDLPNAPVDSILIDPDSPSTIFIGTDIGTFYTSTTGGSWSTLGTGLPNVVVVSLALYNPTRTLRAATHGRGMWDLNIATLLAVPSILSLSPSSVTAGGPAFTLTVNGDAFDSTSTVQWNGASLTGTMFVSSTQVTVTVPATDIALGGTAQVTVLNTDSGEVSNMSPFSIDNPVPVVSTLSPVSVLAGSGQFTLTVTGSNFVGGSVVQWNGISLTTIFVTSGKLTATVPATDVATAGTVPVTVLNPAPGGGSSSAITFTIDNPVPTAASLSPGSTQEGGAQFTLTVNGTNFVTTSTVVWNVSNLATTFVNSTQLTANVPSTLIVNAGAESVTVVNAAPGGGTSNALTFDVDNPAPTATSIAPTKATAGGAAFTLTVTGANFVNNSKVQWNGSARTTTFVKSTKLTAMITAADIANGGTVPVTVMNPAPGGGTSGAVTFTIDNPVPKETSISPSSANAGGAAFTLTVTGTNFVSTSVVQWNGSSRVTTFVNGTTLHGAITAADIATAGTVKVTVMNPAPGGGTSPPQTFTINDPAPTATSLSPSSTTAGGPAFTLTVTGTNFVAGSEVKWKGSARTTTFVSTTKITAAILASDIATAGSASVTVYNAPPGGGTSAALTFSVNNPVPAITTISPTSAIAGGATFTLTVNGTNFVSTSSVRWNGASQTTTFVSGTKLTAAITATDISKAGVFPVTVFNGTPGGGTSNSVNFTVNNPVPAITSISPTSATAGGPSFTLTVNGTGFVSGGATASAIDWNGAKLGTTFVSSIQLTATVPASDIHTAGTASVTVVNPTPGGGTSNAETFTINP
jgi:photosystem II stability/assembly factor-like uncharacterized protein